ncbi:winged helix-turn-helix domain-containing protein [Paraburkholderia diazotrophica]|uniref:winged helix-turn-helix domain-containing protein n=1 Tax=Paraburkholderia diazotrophica TaxID=667676 RepID=UPI003898F70A
MLSYSECEIDIDRGQFIAGRAVALRPRTFTLLKYLALHLGRLLSCDELIEAVWRDRMVTDDSLVPCISEIRCALGDHRQRAIRTVPRRGYMLELRPIKHTAPPEGEVTRSLSPARASGSHVPAQPDSNRRGCAAHCVWR